MLGYRFEKVVASIFASYNFTVSCCDTQHDLGYDILAVGEHGQYLIEVKFSRTKRIPNSSLFDVAARLSVIANSNGDILNPSYPVLVVGASLNSDLRKRIEDIGVIAIDIENLLFLVQNNEEIKSELLSILDYSVNDLLPKEPSTYIFRMQCKPVKPLKSKGDNLQQRIHEWQNSNGSAAYEDLCFETLKYLFDDELSLWHRQQNSNSDLYRFDLICKIKDGEVSGLWSTIVQCFNSKYIIFEFKNYTDPITQKEIYTTDKYLYLKALRGVAIIVSCKGASQNAHKAIRGTLRENGKLILSIDNSDLIKMIEIKMNEGVPADHLYAKFDELLIDLEK